MSGTPHVQRGIHLVDAGRFDQALVEFTKALATDPDRPDVLCNIALCEWELGRKKDAYSHVQQAMGMAPGSTLPMFYHGRFLVEDGKRKKALDVVDQALAIDPEDPDLFSLKAAALSGMNRWRPALKAAEAGLALDAEHEACLSARTMALTVLKDKRAHESARKGLEADAESPVAHRMQGFHFLHTGKPREAVASFGEALRLDPTDESAREGLLEALRAVFPPYRWLLAYSLLCVRLGRASFFLILGLILARRFLAESLKNADATGASPIVRALSVLGIAVAAFLIYGWVFITPLTSVALLFHPVGKRILELHDRVQARFFAAFAIVAVVAGIGSIAYRPLSGLAIVGLLFSGTLGLLSLIHSSPRLKLFLAHLLAVVGVLLALLVAPWGRPAR